MSFSIGTFRRTVTGCFDGIGFDGHGLVDRVGVDRVVGHTGGIVVADGGHDPVHRVDGRSAGTPTCTRSGSAEETELGIVLII